MSVTTSHGLRALRARFPHVSLVVIVALTFTFGYALGVGSSRIVAQDDTSLPPDAQQAFRPFFQVYNLIQAQYIDDVDIETLVDGAAEGMVDALEDEYSSYMDADAFPILNSDLTGEFEGIGVVISTNDETDEIEVVGLLDGAPAGKAGLLPGDVFVAVDGEDISEWDQTEFAVQVRGPAGTEVEITIRRGDELLDFRITRERIVVENVVSELVADDTIAYIGIREFNSETRALIDQAVAALDVNQRDGLILDVRDNPGGFLDSAINVTSAFIEQGTILVEQFSEDNETVYTATGEYAGITVPIVLLTNESSASASEILAGALQDTESATLIGETTLGKGTVQVWSPLVNGGGVRLTIARWLTPERRWIQDQGVTPDITIEFTPQIYNDPNDPQLDAAIRFLQGEAVEPVFELQQAS
jgi:carboxyl-terminal processing protease